MNIIRAGRSAPRAVSTLITGVGAKQRDKERQVYARGERKKERETGTKKKRVRGKYLAPGRASKGTD